MDFFYYLIGGTVFIVLLILIRRYLLFKELFFTSKYEEEFVINKKEGDINSLILNALRKSNFFKISTKNDCFSSYTIPSIWSWSEKIIVKYKRINENTYQIFFSSTCFFPLQIFDWGKNKRNFNKFYRQISETH